MHHAERDGRDPGGFSRSISEEVRTAAAVRHAVALFLGRPVRGLDEVTRLAAHPESERIRAILTGREFRDAVELPLTRLGSVLGDRYAGQPTRRLTDWLCSSLPITAATRTLVGELDDWRPLLAALWQDDAIRSRLNEDGLAPDRSARLAASLAGRPDRDLALAHGARLSITGRAELYLVADEASLDLPTGDDAGLADAASLVNVARVGHSYRATAADPQLIVDRALAPGLYHLALALALSDDDGRPVKAERTQLFLRFDGAFREYETFTFAVRDGRLAVSGILRLDDPVETLRLDPSYAPCRFALSRFAVQDLTTCLRDGPCA